MIAWSDVDGFQEWTDKLAQMTSCPAVTPGLTGSLSITVSPLLQQVATLEDFAAHIDIAEWLVRCSRPGVDCHSERSPQGAVEESHRHSASFLRAARYLPPETMDAVEGLIDDLGLKFFGAEKVIEETSDEVSE